MNSNPFPHRKSNRIGGERFFLYLKYSFMKFLNIFCVNTEINNHTYSIELLDIQLTVISAHPSSLGDTSDCVWVSLLSDLLLRPIRRMK